MKKPRFTRFQILVHLSAWIPLVILVVDFFTNHLTFNPIQAAEIRTGDTAIVLLILSLACTPINYLFHLPQLIKVRRPLGLYAYLYAAIHLAVFAGLDYGFDAGLILQTITEKPYIILGLSTFLILSVLALTSFRKWIVRLGKKWKPLHRLVYLANVLVVLHFGLAIKGDFFHLQGDVFRPFIAGIIVCLLLVLRLPAVRKKLTGQISPFVQVKKKTLFEKKVGMSE
jgi:methionine sulfoxide reductase heme-binding subunit